MERAWTGHVFIATSLDGYIARLNGTLEFLTDPSPEPRHVAPHMGGDAPPDYATFTAGISHLVMGRGTYDAVASFAIWPYDGLRVLVLSRTLAGDADERIVVVRSVLEACAVLASESATAIYVDGGQVVSRFLADDLIDELVITRAPLILGQGLPLFHQLPREIPLVHLGTSTTDTGMTNSRYRVIH